MQIRTLLKKAISELKQSGSESPRLDAELLMMSVTHFSKVQLITHDLDELGPLEAAVFSALLEKRKQGHPIAHLMGQRDFWDLSLKVTPDTLIPRPDTEVLVEKALTLIDCHKLQSVLDLGTGSGAIILALKHVRPELKASAVDFSCEALQVAMENAQNYDLDINFYLGSWFEALVHPVELKDQQLVALPHQVTPGLIECIKARSVQAKLKLNAGQLSSAQNAAAQLAEAQLAVSKPALGDNDLSAKLCFDMIVSNPPYIEEDDPHLSKGDVRFEPLSALVSGKDGLNDIRKIVAQAVFYLNEGGYLLLEHGYNQGAAVRELLRQSEFENIETIKDYGLNERVTLGRYYRHHGSKVL